MYPQGALMRPRVVRGERLASFNVSPKTPIINQYYNKVLVTKDNKIDQVWFFSVFNETHQELSGIGYK